MPLPKRTLKQSAFFSAHEENQNQLPLSLINTVDSASLYAGIKTLERALMLVGHGIMDSPYVAGEQVDDRAWLKEDVKASLIAIEHIRTLIHSEINRHGDLY